MIRKKTVQTPAQKKYNGRIRRRKFSLHALHILSFFAVLILSTVIFISNYSDRLIPQVSRAVIQVARLLPQLEKNETMLRDAYEQMISGWEKIYDPQTDEYKQFISMQDKQYKQIVDDTLSWMNRVTKLRVGRDGFMFVVSKETNRILAHPNEEYLGRQFSSIEELKDDDLIPIESIHPWTKAENLELHFKAIEPYKFAANRVETFSEASAYLRMSLFGCVIDNQDTYIICGIPLTEMMSYVLGNALIFSAFFLILFWLLVKWICLEMDSRRETVKMLRLKLFSYALLVCLVLFGISWYAQILSDVTNDLQTMDKHADVAVETLNTYQEQREKLNSWLDQYYENQCWIACQLVKESAKETLTRQDMQEFADDLNVKHIYVFDQKGKVLVTNSPYDHFELSDDPEDPSYEFHILLDGVFGIIKEPATDKRYNEYVQYVGMSLRNESDLCDGFVMIAVDPTLRDDLLSPLTVDTVLSNMIIGLPEYAIAINKETLNIVSTTGIGFKDASIESLGLKEENLNEDFSGFLKINGTTYYAGVSETSDLYLVPIVTRSGKMESFVNSLKMSLLTVITSLLIILLTLFRYKHDVLDCAPIYEEKDEAGAESTSSSEAEGSRLFSGFSSFVKVQEKRGLDERWKMNDIPKKKQTPEQRIGHIIYRLLLLFCLFILLPTLYFSLDRSAKGIELNNLAYVISGNWQKGMNIFALTSCIFLLCALYVAVELITRILYLVARVSDMRVETVCLLLRNALKYICVIVFIYYGLSQFGVDTQTLLASAGILSLMISFGAKDLVSDILAGFFTLFEGSYKVGDFITVGSWYGTVTEIGLRTTKVQFFSETKIFNNSSMRDIINTDGAVSRMILKMPISYDADLIEIEAVLAEELPRLMDQIPGLIQAPSYEGIESLEDSSILLRIVIYVSTREKFSAFRKLNREVKLIFDRHGIEIPYNQLVVHEGKENSEPPVDKGK